MLRKPVCTVTPVRRLISAWMRRARFSPPLRMPMRTRSRVAPVGSMIWWVRRSTVRWSSADENTTSFSRSVGAFVVAMSGRLRRLAAPALPLHRVDVLCRATLGLERGAPLASEFERALELFEPLPLALDDIGRRFAHESFGSELPLDDVDLARALLHLLVERRAFALDDRCVDRQED